MKHAPKEVAVLTSGGLDSTVLLAHMASLGSRVHPVYVRQGLYWETEEHQHLLRFLAAIRDLGVQELTVLELPAKDLYGDHWSLTGLEVPDAETSDEAVYLPGRNLLLLSKVAVWCERNGINAMALGTLKGNPFSDNTTAFYQAMCRVLSMALACEFEILTPFGDLSKEEVIGMGRGLPLELTFSCILPINGSPCGACNKCAERKRALDRANGSDATNIASTPAR